MQGSTEAKKVLITPPVRTESSDAEFATKSLRFTKRQTLVSFKAWAKL